VANALAGGLGGVASGEFRETDRRTPIKVRFAGNANEDLETALATPVRGIPVGQLVSTQEIRAPVEVVRINQRPVSVIEAVVEKGGTARANRDVLTAVSRLAPPPGVTWQVAGADAEQRRTTRELSLVAILSAALMYLVLAGEFASFTTPILVMLKEREPRYQQLRARIERGGKAERRLRAVPTNGQEAAEEEPEAAPAVVAAAGGSRQAGRSGQTSSRPRPKSKRRPPAKRRRR